MSEPPQSFPFSEWEGQRTQHVALSPDGTPFAIPSGAHERLHALVVGDTDAVAQAKGSPPKGTKVELALAGWVQLQSDELIDRINVDAPDGFADAAMLREFATLHDAGVAWLAFYPSGDTLKLRDPQRASFTRSGPRVPVPLDAQAWRPE
jgi:hypothetical protein